MKYPSHRIISHTELCYLYINVSRVHYLSGKDDKTDIFFIGKDFYLNTLFHFLQNLSMQTILRELHYIIDTLFIKL